MANALEVSGAVYIMTAPSSLAEQHLQPEFRWVYKAPSRASLGSEVEGASALPL
jgi:hypothetical protein